MHYINTAGGSKIDPPADDKPRCDHLTADTKLRNLIASRTIASGMSNLPGAYTEVCARRYCVLDAMAWVERTANQQALIKPPFQNKWLAHPEDYSAAITNVEADLPIYIRSVSQTPYVVLSGEPQHDSITEHNSDVYLKNLITGRKHYVSYPIFMRHYAPA